jgi:hypothetical protein
MIFARNYSLLLLNILEHNCSEEYLARLLYFLTLVQLLDEKCSFRLAMLMLNLCGSSNIFPSVF